jgi:hypothetical protein
MDRVARLPVFAVAAAAALIGPLTTSPRDKPAGVPFVFVPPAEFEPAREDVVKEALGTAADSGAKVWLARSPGAATTPNISLTFSKQTPGLEDEDLRTLAAGMPQVFSAQGSTWTEVRHETRRRADGTRVGLLDGELSRGDLKKRVLQVAFPIDTGAALITMTVPASDFATWEPKLDASIATATGVAWRAPKVPVWLYAVWGLGGGVLAYLALALFAKKKAAPQ